jgi:hypothetical protein
MNLKIVQDDPLLILTSTKPIVEKLQFITIHKDKLEYISKVIDRQLKKGLETLEQGFNFTFDFEKETQLIFLLDTVNFCFWNKKDEPKWIVEYPKGDIATGGWFSLIKCFQRALDNKIPLLDVYFLNNLTFKTARNIFKGKNDTNIPLLKKRVENLKEATHILIKKYKGKIANLLEESRYDAIKIAKLTCENFPSFQDITELNGYKIFFLKRAQIFVQDLSYLSKKYRQLQLKNLPLLTAFADYKLPQMLRKYDVIGYTKNLSQRIDNYVLIPKNSREEIEIRSATIWCIELIRQKLNCYSAAEIDNALWLISQDQTNTKPYHRTYTIYY